MIHFDSLASISDDELFAGVERLTARSNVALADLLAHLGEVERRGIHRLRACASLYTYCIYELRMSEDAAYRRSKAARLVRQYPELHAAIAKGEIHLTGVLMIGPHLGGERHAEILQRARFRSKRELLRLIAEIDPKPEVPALVEPLGPAPAGRATHAAFVTALAGPERELPSGRRPEDWMPRDRTPQDAAPEGGMPRDRAPQDAVPEHGMPEHAVEQTDGTSDSSEEHPETSANAPDAEQVQCPLHYRVQFTASQEFVDLLDEVRALLGHERSGTDLPEIQLRALRALVKELRAKKRAMTDRPREQVVSRAAIDAPEREARLARDETDAPAREPRAATTDALERKPDAVAACSNALARGPGSDTITDAPARFAERASRYIPAQVRRAVFDRDACRCAYHDERGERCRETGGLELHHRRAHALGGAPTLENLELRCRPHNTLAAERDFGREHIDWMRGVTEDSGWVSA